MHTMWKGSVSFGLVNVPVRMFAATESKDVKFKYLHKECKTPIQYTRVCPQCDRHVEWSEIVKGFEYQPNQFVVFSDDELGGLKRTRSQTIDIVEFVELSEIDPVYYDKTYYLSPDSSGIKAYHLLTEAMSQTGKIAIARTVLRNAETLACVRTHNGVMMMETLFWPDEVRTTEELPNIHRDASLTEQERDMAVKLIQQLATSFAPEKYEDEHRNEILSLIQKKVSNADITKAQTPVGKTENIVDLMQALQESIKLTKPTKKRVTSTTKRTS
jgi:DNA end-binding protein Ku